MPLYSPNRHLGTFTTVASMPSAAQYAGYRLRLSVSGLDLELASNGTRWRPVNGEAMLKLSSPNVSGIANTLQTVFTQSLPAGLIQGGDTLRFVCSIDHNGTTDTVQGALYMGATGTTADTAIVAQYTWINAGLTAGHQFDIRMVGTTSTQREGTGPGTASSSYSAPVGTARPAAVPLAADLATTAQIFSCAIRSAGATNTVGFYTGQLEWLTA